LDTHSQSADNSFIAQLTSKYPFTLKESSKMLRCSAIVSLVAAALFLSPLNSTATEQDHSNPFIAVKLDTVLPKPLSDLTATRVDDVVYIVGGCDAEDGNRFEAEIGEFLCGSVSNKLYRFDPATEQFTELSSMPTPRYRHASVAVKSVADSTDSAVIVVLGGRDVKDDIITTVDVSMVQYSNTLSSSVVAVAVTSISTQLTHLSHCLYYISIATATLLICYYS
jgi:hypothetical protein